MMTTMVSDAIGPVEADDLKLVTLARGARSRVGAQSGAAVRDETGRTYSSADVSLPSFEASALALAVAQAVASGARGIEAAVVVGSAATEIDLAVVVEAGGAGAVVWNCAADGTASSRVDL